MCLNNSYPIVGFSSINFFKSFFASIAKTSEPSKALTRASFLLSALSRLASHKKSQLLSTANCFVSVLWVLVYFSILKIHFFIM
jgi:hypothetical protein